jgi:hypothetical protein
MSPEEFAEAQRLWEVTEAAVAEERWRMCLMMAAKKSPELLGNTEFELRKHIHRIGAITLEAAVNERRKKGGTSVAASLVENANTTRNSSAGDRRRS